MEFADLIGNLGFPMACAIGMAFYLKTTAEAHRLDSKEREEHYREHQRLMVEELSKISSTIDRINDRLEDIENKVQRISNEK